MHDFVNLQIANTLVKVFMLVQNVLYKCGGKALTRLEKDLPETENTYAFL